jgi:hypothetical protein
MRATGYLHPEMSAEHASDRTKLRRGLGAVQAPTHITQEAFEGTRALEWFRHSEDFRRCLRGHCESG